MQVLIPGVRCGIIFIMEYYGLVASMPSGPGKVLFAIMYKNCSRLVCLLRAFLMVGAVLPAGVFAEEVSQAATA